MTVPFQTHSDTWLDAHSAGSGPYILEKWEKQVETVLVQNPNYSGTAPYFDRIIIKNLPEASTQVVALQGGEIDLALDITANQVAAIKNNPDLKVYQGPTSNLHFLLFNEDAQISDPLADSKVQPAVRYALDYPGYVQLWGGVTSASIFPSWLLWSIWH